MPWAVSLLYFTEVTFTGAGVPMCHHSFQQAQGQLWLGSHLRPCHRKFRSTEGLGAELDVGAEQAWQAQHPKSNGGGEREKRKRKERPGQQDDAAELHTAHTVPVTAPGKALVEHL